MGIGYCQLFYSSFKQFLKDTLQARYLKHQFFLQTGRGPSPPSTFLQVYLALSGNFGIYRASAMAKVHTALVAGSVQVSST
ncbi:hypothetical protein Holit_01321 [Hollandina sp. SP2]